MPKVVSFRNKVFTNANRNLRDDKFHVFHCKKCNNHVLITDMELTDIPRRRTDNAIVFDTEASVVKLNTNAKDEPVVIKREKGVERQWHHFCPECGQLVAYQSCQLNDNPRYFYLVDNNIVWPRFRKRTPWVCKVCGYVCRDSTHLEQHKKSRGHENQEEGRQDDPDAPIAPIIVG
ncbi:unnamed protein product [Vitrella brassicaformis CCMP3155]|uniref:C2H2-type domain-containing protein n=2 Tax=Vitrella brassicaformis TaxID=1169539 RepID=A0A0G4FSU0_VITBC|nr:unnamed protein product [Vitrella brassicaformis CCMP3155]|mmetsp:Transcript_34856/g.86504  ORF Transcript_34856/g.86504 Transcript_34856/m.86504 type:complete len:176 (+) Transcript_34856:86-613(+)|eukprot:CEM17362.1 unnamed protein product [Vitrella brassicaformis CCMP3155]